MLLARGEKGSNPCRSSRFTPYLFGNKHNMELCSKVGTAVQGFNVSFNIHAKLFEQRIGLTFP